MCESAVEVVSQHGHWRAGVVDTDLAVETFAEEKTQSSIHAAVQCCLYRRRRRRPYGFFEKKKGVLL